MLESGIETAAVRKAQQELSAAQSQLQDLKSGKRPLEIDVIREQQEQHGLRQKNQPSICSQ